LPRWGFVYIMTPAIPSDEALFERIRKHDEQALQILLQRYQSRLHEFSLKLIGRRDLAEEAVANVFLNIWRRRQTLIIKASARHYLYSATGNQSINLSKSQNQQGIVHLDHVPPGELADTARTDTRILYQEFHDEIDKLLMELPARRREIFRMNRLEGLSYIEIATSLGLSVYTIQNHMTRAIKQLADRLPDLKSGMVL
jgi:RNA polymerase sigma-70 factor, ECF subfamily